MNEESSRSETESRDHEDGTPVRQSEHAAARMGARQWVIATTYSQPAAHGIPKLPDWDVRRTDSNGLAFAADDDAAAFISAQQPMKARR